MEEHNISGNYLTKLVRSGIVLFLATALSGIIPDCSTPAKKGTTLKFYEHIYSNVRSAYADNSSLDDIVKKDENAKEIESSYQLARSDTRNARLKRSSREDATKENSGVMAIKIKPYHLDYMLFVELSSKSDSEGTINKWKEVIRINPNDAEAHYNLAEVLITQGDFGGAIRESKESIKIEPNNANAHLLWGVALITQGDFGGAIREYKRAIILKPDFAVAHSSLGNVLYNKGDLEGAMSEWREATKINQNSIIPPHLGTTLEGTREGVVSHYKLGETLKNKKDLEGAMSEWREVIKIEPNLPDVRYNLGVALYRNNNLEGAMSEWRESIKTKPAFALAHNSLGIALADRKDLEGAISELREAIRINPNYAEAHYNLGNVLYNKGDLEGAMSEWKEVIKIEYDIPDTHHNLGIALADRKDLEGAISELREAIRINPNDGLYKNNLMIIYIKKGWAEKVKALSDRPFYEEYYYLYQEKNFLEPLIEDPQIKELRRAYAQVEDIHGAIYDRETGWPIIFGSIKHDQNILSDASLMRLDELIMCIKVIQENLDPGVSIDPPYTPPHTSMLSVPTTQTIRYIPENIRNTYLGRKVFEADRALKGLSFGCDPMTHRKVHLNLPGYKTLPEFARKNKNLEVGHFGRIWFKPKEVLLIKNGDSILFDRINIKVESESPYPSPSEFASYLENHYKELSEKLPIYKDIVWIGKEVAIARWLVEERHILDLEDYRMQYVYTPQETYTLMGAVRGSYYLCGGVIYNTPNRYILFSDLKETNLMPNVKINKSLEDITDTVLTIRIDKTNISWRYKLEGVDCIAIALPFKGTTPQPQFQQYYNPQIQIIPRYPK